MDLTGIGFGLIILTIIGIVGYLALHHAPPVAQPNAKDLSGTLAAAGTTAWEAIKRDLPSIVSAEVAQLRADKAALTTRAEQAEAALATEIAASGARLEAVKAQVGSVIAGIGSLPASAVPVAAVAAAQADDLAAVVAARTALSPAS